MSFFTRLFNKGEEPPGEVSETTSQEASTNMPPREPNDRPRVPDPVKTAPEVVPAPVRRAGNVPGLGATASPGTYAINGTAKATTRGSTAPPSKARPPSIAPPPLPPAARSAPPPALQDLSTSYSNPFAPEDTIVEKNPLSARPTTNWDLATTAEQPSIAETFALLLKDVDNNFGALEMRQGDPHRPDAGHPGHLESANLEDVRELFAQLAANHMRQVRDFMIDVKWGEATRDWVGVCEPAIKSLRRAAEKLELGELCVALDAYQVALTSAAESVNRTVQGEVKDRLIATYDTLHAFLPRAFALETDRTARESIIVQSLLLQIPEVRKVTIDKLYAAGLTSLEVIYSAKADEIAATTGIGFTLAARIVERFQSYRRDLRSVVPDANRSNEREKLAALAVDLRRLHDDYERAADAWTAEATQRKRELRQKRDAGLLEVKVILARLGEVGRLAAIERLPFEKKLGELQSFLDDAADRHLAG